MIYGRGSPAQGTGPPAAAQPPNVKKRIIHELAALHERAPAFRDRAAAGRALAGMLERFRGSTALILAIPSGGVPVAAEMAVRLGLPLEAAPVSKVLLPWTTEAGYGAVAFDGTVWIDERAARHHGLTEKEVARGVAEARAKVERRLARLRAGRPLPDFTALTVIVVDDGVAAGSTLRTAIAALRQQHAGRIIVAVPTGHEHALVAIAGLADEVYCANVRGGLTFAVADAYEQWRDVSEEEVVAILRPMAAARNTQRPPSKNNSCA